MSWHAWPGKRDDINGDLDLELSDVDDEAVFWKWMCGQERFPRGVGDVDQDKVRT